MTAIETGRPSFVAARLTAVAAVSLGVSAVTGYTLAPDYALRLPVAVTIAVLGVVVHQLAAKPGARLFGPAVLHGAGGAALVGGAYLTGPPLVLLVEGTPEVAALLTYGPVIFALAMLAVLGERAGVIGATAVTPLLLSTLLQPSVEPPTVAGTMLVLAAVATVAGILVPRLTTPWIVFGAMSVSAAGGIQVLFAVLAGPSSVQAGESNAVVLACGLVLSIVLALTAALRRDLAAGVAAGLSLITSPATASYSPTDVAGVTIIPILVIVLVGAVLAASIPGVGAVADRVAERLRPGGGTSPSAMFAVAGMALVALAVMGLPAMDLGDLVHGLAELALLAVSGVLAWRIRGVPGAMLACVLMAGLLLLSPWLTVLNGFVGEPEPVRAVLEWGLGIDAVVDAVIAVLLVRGHPRGPVAAVAAFLALRCLGSVFALVNLHTDAGPGLMTGSLSRVIAALLIGVPAVLIVLCARSDRVRALIQPIGAAALVWAGFALFTAVQTFGDHATSGVPGPSVVIPSLESVIGMGLLLALTVLAVLTTTRRSSPGMVFGAALVVTLGTQIALF
ncbi:MAG: hypothetical protein M3548_19295, partial [Actinomycetota bacterium]|nr:hypothetical protein [Actinomycetota bacterium]